jgi:DNA repair photolyase
MYPTLVSAFASARSCRIIYTPRGAAREYADLALNIYTGCTHGCRYCYAAATMRKSKGAFFSSPFPRKNILSMVQHDSQWLAKWVNVPEILISFIGDPYQPAEKELGLTRQGLEILIHHNLPFTILTKGNPERDFDLLSKYPKARIGVTLTFLYQDDLRDWEPNAPPIVNRFNVLARAKDAGIPTWVSLEPVIDPDQALLIIGLYNRYVDLWRIGKINHCKQMERRVDWPAFVREASMKLDCLGANYEFKQSLRQYM